MKKYITVIILVAVMVWVGGCGSQSEKVAEEELTISERIEAASTFEDIIDCSRDTEEGSEEETMLLDKTIEYLFSDTTLDGTYYKSEVESEGDIVIDAIGRDEIYVLPIEDADGFEGSVSELQNADDYKYKIVNVEINNIADCINMDLNRMADDYAIALTYVNSPERINAWELPQWEDYFGGAFYADKSAAQEKIDEELAEEAEKRQKEKALKESDPKVGMTESEVLKSKWGYPDDKNIDEYEWGTSEQWVYKGKGYVYFENGIVTSVSHR